MENLIPNGSKVKIKDKELSGKTIGVCIRGINPNVSIEYHVAFWVNGQRNTEWLYGYEIEPNQTQKQPAGFHKQNQLLK